MGNFGYDVPGRPSLRVTHPEAKKDSPALSAPSAVSGRKSGPRGCTAGFSMVACANHWHATKEEKPKQREGKKKKNFTDGKDAAWLEKNDPCYRFEDALGRGDGFLRFHY